MATRSSAFAIRELEDFFVPMLRNCFNVVKLKKIQAHIVKLSLSQSNFLLTKMVDVCDNIGNIEYASLLFKQVVKPNGFSYNAMIRAYTHHHQYGVAITLYQNMLRDPQTDNPIWPDKFTFPFVIKCSAGLLCHFLGQELHAQVCKFGPKSNLIIENALIDMYTKCYNFIDAHKVFERMTERDTISWNCLLFGHVRLGQMRRARAIFDDMPDKTIVSWTTLISGYARIGCYVDALDVFRRMQVVGIEPDEISIVSVLPACAQLGALEVGKWIHMYSDKNGLSCKTNICNALIEMYAKCGCIDEARQLFGNMVDRDVITWSTMLGGLANHGKAREAIELFQDMQIAKVQPNGITFLSILSACTHAGLWDEGLKYFDCMRCVCRIEPEIEHYGCLIDLLGRSGRLVETLDAIQKMPMKPDSKIWGSLLSSCRIHSNLEIAIIAMEHLLEFEPDDTGNYVLLSNIYADLGKWEGVSRMRKLIRSKSMQKMPGCSVIEVNNVVQDFVSGDHSKPFSKDVFWILELLALHQDRTDDMREVAQED
ncbi:hypothetical protein CJ030_MR8G028128 [Morella rubra]|uniref:Pentatricopeptide repeat-containing protein n=1 Tax=Morella rubra TaxID=262757 RepID=A0A6A1UWL4_9ROSI|nr:hypothetical protein CJ030_MR8G028128 [Morella rubra]